MKKPTPTKSQAEKFRDAAREVEADDDETRFAGRLKRIAVKKEETAPKGEK